MISLIRSNLWTALFAQHYCLSVHVPLVNLSLHGIMGGSFRELVINQNFKKQKSNFKKYVATPPDIRIRAKRYSLLGIFAMCTPRIIVSGLGLVYGACHLPSPGFG